MKVRVTRHHASYLLEDVFGRKVVVPSHWLAPAGAVLVGWRPCHTATDGMHKCPVCGRVASQNVLDAVDFLDQCVGDVVEVDSDRWDSAICGQVGSKRKEPVMAIDDLQPLDAIISYKEPPSFWKNPIAHTFDNLLLWHGKRTYPDGEWKATHARGVVGKIGDRVLGFEWTFPAARFIEIEPWMIHPEYASVYRWNEEVSISPDDVFWACQPWDGTMYDILQPLGILLNLRRIFDGGRRNLVCSVGLRMLWEEFFGKNLFPEVSVQRTIPCSWMNHPELCSKVIY